jgi:magnesium transporter
MNPRSLTDKARRRSGALLRVARRKLHSSPGASPGTLESAPNAVPSQVSLFAYGPDGFLEEAQANLDLLPSCLARYPVTWVNVDGLGSIDVIKKIGEIFDLHALALEDVLNPAQRAKTDWYEHFCFCVVRMINAEESLCTEQLNLFFGPSFVVTFQERPGDCFGPVRERIRRAGSRHRASGADYLVYSLLDLVIDGYFPALEHYGEELDLIEDKLIENAESSVMYELQGVRRNLLEFRRAVWPLREAVNALQREPSPLIQDATRLYLRDCYDHTVQVIDLLESYRELGASLMDVYMSSVSKRMNEVMKVLTVISTIFIPMTFIASIYGMNFTDMPELHWHWGYPLALGFMALIGGGLALWFWRRGWFKQ